MQKKTNLISVPMDLGANIDGSRGGPETLVKMIEELQVFNSYIKTDVAVPVKTSESLKTKYKKEIEEVCRNLRDQTLASEKRGEFPLILGGDHSLALGSVFGSQLYCENKRLKLGVVWLDAHADMNTPESSETGNIHGMPLATILGLGHCELTALSGEVSYLQGNKVYLAGLRSVDKKEEKIVSESGVNAFTMNQIRHMGIEVLAKEIKENLVDKVDHIHFSFDLDVMDPCLAPSVSTPEEKGMSLEELDVLIHLLVSSKKLLAMDLVEYNPLNEQGGKGLRTVQKILEKL
mgnify:CR=1 FL=1